ncbi:hypothetical protein BC831DRAFT_442726 [Entophlyctis helioformis]|nr:hypothetical protein BC831DRAFT_442726 [Entophlyctis helioformis]
MACETDSDEAGCKDISWTPHRDARDRGECFVAAAVGAVRWTAHMNARHAQSARGHGRD